MTIDSSWRRPVVSAQNNWRTNRLFHETRWTPQILRDERTDRESYSESYSERYIPCWARDSTSRPSSLKTSDRINPFPAALAGELWANRSQLSARTGR